MGTRDKLAWTAAKLFQEKGFDGVGIAEILKATGVPKGSLYHHFPNGKSDLALGAADLANREMLRIIDDAYAEAADYKDGTVTLFYKLAKLFEILGKHTGCPVSEILVGGPDRAEFRAKTAEYFEAWMAQVAAHAVRLGEDIEVAEASAHQLFLVMQGGWTLARAKQDSDVMRGLPALLFSD